MFIYIYHNRHWHWVHSSPPYSWFCMWSTIPWKCEVDSRNKQFLSSDCMSFSVVWWLLFCPISFWDVNNVFPCSVCIHAVYATTPYLLNACGQIEVNSYYCIIHFTLSHHLGIIRSSIITETVSIAWDILRKRWHSCDIDSCNSFV